MRCGDHDQGPLECHEEPREVLVDRPVEECGMESFNTCRPVTRLTPSLVPKQTCRDVPRETCSNSKVSPHYTYVILNILLDPASEASGVLPNHYYLPPTDAPKSATELPQKTTTFERRA